MDRCSCKVSFLEYDVIVDSQLEFNINFSEVQGCKMDLGSTIAVFFLVATILLALFCILTKYYSYRIKRKRRTAVQLSSLDNSLHNLSIQLISGAYQQFKANREQQKNVQKQESLIMSNELIEKAQIKQILDISNNIYGITALRQRLDSDTLPLQSQTHRSMISLKQFNIQRLNTMQSHRERKIYHYVKKLISYDQSGLNISQIIAEFIRKRRGQCEVIKDIDSCHVLERSQGFNDQLEAHGFCIGSYGYYQYTHYIDITDLKDGEVRPIKTLENNISKEVVNHHSFQLQRQKMLNKK